MHRLPIEDDHEATRARPDDSVFDAAAAIERFHGALVVKREGNPVGLLTEDDIVNRVLAVGRDPQSVRVAEVMHAAHLAPDGHTLIVEDGADPFSPLHGAEPLVEVEDLLETGAVRELAEGICEECNAMQDHLEEMDGELVCEECMALRGGPALA